MSHGIANKIGKNLSKVAAQFPISVKLICIMLVLFNFSIAMSFQSLYAWSTLLCSFYLGIICGLKHLTSILHGNQDKILEIFIDLQSYNVMLILLFKKKYFKISNFLFLTLLVITYFFYIRHHDVKFSTDI